MSAADERAECVQAVAAIWPDATMSGIERRYDDRVDCRVWRAGRPWLVTVSLAGGGCVTGAWCGEGVWCPAGAGVTPGVRS